jgi:hypothetical protein
VKTLDMPTVPMNSSLRLNEVFDAPVGVLAVVRKTLRRTMY